MGHVSTWSPGFLQHRMAERKNYAVDQVNLCKYRLALSPTTRKRDVVVKIKCYVTKIHFSVLLSCLYHKTRA